MILAPIEFAWEQFRRNVAYASQGLRRSPVFTLVVTVTLALGIGANTAVIGIIDTMFFRKLPVPHPERIVAIYSGDKRDRARRAGQSPGTWSTLRDYREIRGRVRGVTGLAAYSMANVYPGDPLADDYMWTAFVSGNYFDVLDVRAQIGRTIQRDEDDPPGAHPVVVISDFIWRSKFAADPGVLGRQIRIRQTSFTIIGVAPKGFTGVHPEGRTNLWIPYAMTREAMADSASFSSGDAQSAQIIGRLAPGATLDEVQASVAIAAQDLRERYPASDSLIALRASIRDRLTTYELSPNALQMFALVWIMVALLHLVACSNVASLMVARAASRRRELGMRLCLGASRARVLAESLTEAGLLALIGAAGGLLVGRWLSGLIAQMQFLSTSDPGLDFRVLAIVAIVTVGTVAQFGLLPALDASRADPLALLRGEVAPRRASGLDRAGMIVVGQVAMSLLLLSNSAAFLQLFAHQIYAAPGFDAEHLVVASFRSRTGGKTVADWAAAYEEIMARVSVLPGVRGVAATQGAPLYGARRYEEIVVPGRTAPADEHAPSALQAIGPGYFAAIGATMVRGREFTAQDRAAPAVNQDAYDVVIVNEVMAHRYWPGANPLGKQLALRSGATATVVGVVRDMHDVSTVGFTPRAYFPLLETRYVPTFDLVVRVAGEPRAALAEINSVLQASPSVSRARVQLMSDIRDGALSLSRAAGLGLAICASVALLLTSIGLYGIVTMWATQRRREIGIRLALGAPHGDVHRLLLTGIAQLLAVGAALGLVCAFGIVQVERGWMGPILALNAPPIIASIAVFAGIGGLAALIPSVRAARQPPAEVLRSG